MEMSPINDAGLWMRNAAAALWSDQARRTPMVADDALIFDTTEGKMRYCNLMSGNLSEVCA